jgi:hypothetical protein
MARGELSPTSIAKTSHAEAVLAAIARRPQLTGGRGEG